MNAAFKPITQENHVTYADGRLIHDADSHLMPTADFLAKHADPKLRDALR